ncbi:MAG: ABC transporter substrate-binding protein [Bdellovibrio sp.]|nr:ABC transporter substrate-binding protein [Bdellovibrio sp.]
MALGAEVANAEGVTDTEIKLGMSNALSGASAALGTGMKSGATAFFTKLNAAGGVAGRKINLVSYDDTYEPAKAVENTKKLIETDKVFALFGYVGTPTSTAVLPLAGKNKVPYFAPFSGAEFLRNPVNPMVYNIRSSYFDETEAQVEFLTTKLSVKKIGIFMQDDAYGAAGESGLLRALKKRNLQITGKGKYARNTVDVAGGVKELKMAAPEAIVMVGSYKACAEFVKQAKASGVKAVFLNLSFVGTSAFISEVGNDGEGVYITQVVPSPWDTSIPVVKEYQADMKAQGATSYDYTSLEGYIAAKAFGEALKGPGKSLTVESLLSSFNGMNIDLGGFSVRFSPTDHAGSKKVWLTIVKGGKAEAVN